MAVSLMIQVYTRAHPFLSAMRGPDKRRNMS